MTGAAALNQQPASLNGSDGNGASDRSDGNGAWRTRRLLIASLFLPVTVVPPEEPLLVSSSSTSARAAAAAAAAAASIASTTESTSNITPPPSLLIPSGHFRPDHVHSASSPITNATIPISPLSHQLASFPSATTAAAPPVEITGSNSVDTHTLSRRLSFVSALSALSSQQAAVKSAKRQLERSRHRMSRPIEPTHWSVESSSAGNIGLQNAISAVRFYDAQSRLWIGTLGANTDDFSPHVRSQLRNRLLVEHSAVPVFVIQDELDGHYHNFCKQVLWRPFHYQLPDYPNAKAYEEASWNHYVAVNQHFAETISEIYREGDIIWVNDYHLMLLPLMIRRIIPGATIGFFLHIPFPSSEIFRCLHVRKQILEGLLGSDLIGFQTYAFMRHFLMTCTRLLALDSTPRGVQLENSVVSVGIYPIGTNLASLNEKRRHPDVSEIIATLREKYAGKHVLIGRDKNDYVKGVRHKILAFERFLTQYPKWQGRVVLIQVLLSTSEANEMECHVTDVVSRINSRFGAIGYVPVVYLQQDISFYHYLALLTIADACLITSLRDGMNLTSHEYAVCQEEKHSPLIISEFAGTYGSFGAALRINPWDHQEVADAIYAALTMSEEEKNMRWQTLYRYVSTNTAQTFVETFVSDTTRFHEENMASMATSIPRLIMEDIHEDYLDCSHRLILLDDVGTLYPNSSSASSNSIFVDVNRVIVTIERLCANPRNLVYIMSTRSRADLDDFFHMPGLGICAENGCFIKFTDRTRWDTMLQDHDLSWRKEVIEILEYYADRTPGSHVEQREIGLVWHFGHADKSFGQWQAAECYNHIETAVSATYPIHALAKKTSVEVLPRNVSKGTAVRRILERHQSRSSHHHHSHIQQQHRTSRRSRTQTYQTTSSSHSHSQQLHALSPTPSHDTHSLLDGHSQHGSGSLQQQSVLMHGSPQDGLAIIDPSLSLSEPGSPLILSPFGSASNSMDHGSHPVSMKLGTSQLNREMETYASPELSGGTSMSVPTPAMSLAGAPSSSASATHSAAHHASSRSSRVDFILCIGDDRSDEYMFEFLTRLEAREHQRLRLMQVSDSSVSSHRDSHVGRSRSTTANDGAANAIGCINLNSYSDSRMNNAADFGHVKDGGASHNDSTTNIPIPIPTKSSTMFSALIDVPVGASPSSVPMGGVSDLDTRSPDLRSGRIDIALSPQSEHTGASMLPSVVAMAGKALSVPTESFLTQPLSKLHISAAGSTVHPSTSANTAHRRRRTIITCTVGAKSSAAGWYLPNTSSVIDGLERLSLLPERDLANVETRK